MAGANDSIISMGVEDVPRIAVHKWAVVRSLPCKRPNILWFYSELLGWSSQTHENRHGSDAGLDLLGFYHTTESGLISNFRGQQCFKGVNRSGVWDDYRGKQVNISTTFLYPNSCNMRKGLLYILYFEGFPCTTPGTHQSDAYNSVGSYHQNNLVVCTVYYSYTPFILLTYEHILLTNSLAVFTQNLFYRCPD